MRRPAALAFNRRADLEGSANKAGIKLYWFEALDEPGESATEAAQRPPRSSRACRQRRNRSRVGRRELVVRSRLCSSAPGPIVAQGPLHARPQAQARPQAAVVPAQLSAAPPPLRTLSSRSIDSAVCNAYRRGRLRPRACSSGSSAGRALGGVGRHDISDARLGMGPAARLDVSRVPRLQLSILRASPHCQGASSSSHGPLSHARCGALVTCFTALARCCDVLHRSPLAPRDAAARTEPNMTGPAPKRSAWRPRSSSPWLRLAPARVLCLGLRAD